MKATIGLAIPENALLRITLELTVSDARSLKAQLANQNPGWAFGTMLSKGIEQAEAHIVTTQEVER